MDIALWQYVFIFILIGFSGFIDSIAGGGGLISIPAYLAVGLPAEFILGTNKCVSSSGTTLAVFRYIVGKTILWRIVGYSIIAALIGSAIGASLSHYLSKEIMFSLLLVVIPTIFFLQYRQGKKTQVNQNIPRGAVIRATMIGLFLGGYDGLFGPGTGTFILLAFMAFLNFSAREASANARIVNYASNISACIYFLVQGRIFWPIAFVAIAGSLCGNWLGSGLVLKSADKIVMPVFRLVLILLMLKCGYDLFL
ncbi:MAG: hypothetical protein CSA20_06120 [Deltaproteobacteria bacterium]|nr:MAG: hypothetical protein CSA20_06120 [Deltaproteobacteria bacterium]